MQKMPFMISKTSWEFSSLCDGDTITYQHGARRTSVADLYGDFIIQLQFHSHSGYLSGMMLTCRKRT